MDFLNQIVGSDLSAITFVRDYYQFQFDGPYFNVMTPVTVLCGTTRVRSGDDQFRNSVCGQIGKSVRSTTFREGDAITITFEDDSQVQFSLKTEDYPGPEAVVYTGNDDVWGVF